MSQLTICLVIFIATLALYASNILPISIVALLSMLAYVFTGCLDGPTALGAFANANTAVLLGMFIVAAGFNRTSFVDKLSAGIVKFAGGSFKRAWLCYILLAFLLTNFIPSPMAVFAIVFPLCTSMCEGFHISPSKVMFGLAVVCIGCCGSLPLGTAITTAMQHNGFFETYGLTGYIQEPINFAIARLPLAIIIILWAYFIIPKIGPDQPVVPIAGGGGSKAAKTPLKPFSEAMGYIIFFAVVVAMIFGSKLGIANWQIALTGALLMVVCGVLTEKETYAAVPTSIIWIYVGALAAGNALTATGAGTVVGDWVAGIVGNTSNSYVVGAMFFVIPFILTQFMLNQGVMNIFTPICLLTCASLGANPIGPMILVQAASLTAFLTPMATPAIPMCMGAGGYDLKSLVKQGWLISVVLSVVYVFYVMTVFPCF